MSRKPITTVIGALCATVLLVPLGAAGVAGAASTVLRPASIAHPGGDDGNLYEDPATFVEGQSIKLTANYPSSAVGQTVTIYKESPAGSGDYVSTGHTEVASSYGNAYFLDYPVAGAQKIFARSSGGLVTEIDTLEPEPLGSCTDTGNFYISPSTVAEGQTVKLTGNFPSSDAGRTITFLRKIGSGDFEVIGSEKASKWGNAYMNHDMAAGTQTMYALIADTNNCTEKHTFTPEPLGSCSDTGNFYISPSTVAEGQTVKLTGNFPSSDAGRTVTFLRKIGSGDFEVIGSEKASSWGNAYLSHEVVPGTQTMYAQVVGTSGCTEKHTFTPVPSSALLDPSFTPAGNGGEDARVKATFEPASSGAKTELQVKTIRDGTWKTIETSKQESDGTTSFYIHDPLEVEHSYRAVSNGIATTNDVTWAGPLLDKGTGVATVHFNSNDGESVNTRSHYFEGDFAMKAGPNFPECEDEGRFKGPTKSEPAEMKGRGNYSWSFPKKSFSLKLDDKNNLCGLGKSKKWALVANDYDRSLIRNTMASWVGTKFENIGWTPQMRPVDLYVNGSYRGAYVLVERVNVEGGRINDGEDELKASEDPTDCTDPNKRTGTYLMEWDFRKGANYNFTAGSRGWVGLKEPEDEDYCSDMGQYINSYVDAADKALFGSNFKDDANGWKKYIDLDSAVDYYLAMEFLKPVDGNMWASVYMYKPRGEKIHLGPLWDFDLAEGSANRAGNVVSSKSWYLKNPLGVSAMQSSKTWFNRLNEDPDFRAAVVKRWNEVDQDLHPSAYIAIYRNQIAASANENFKKWSHGSHISKYQVIKSSWSADVEYVRSWLESRNNWMNSQLDNND